MTATPRNTALTLLDLLREHLAAAEFTWTTYGTDINTTQAALIEEFIREPHATSADLAEKLKVHVSTISRCFKQLTQIGFIKSSVAPDEDKNTVRKLTARGEKYARLQVSITEAIYQRGLTRLTKEEISRLENFLTTLLGYDPDERLSYLPDESRLSRIFRGLTYEHGLISGSYLGSKYSARDWFLLSEIHYKKKSPKGLAELMKASPSTITTLLAGLKRQGLVQDSPSFYDKRGKDLTLTDEGLKALAHIEKLAEERFKNDLRSISKSDLTRYLEIFRAYVENMRVMPQGELSIKRVLPSQLTELRIVAARYIADMDVRYPHKGFLLHHDNTILIANSNQSTGLVIEVIHDQKGSEAHIVNIISLGDPLKIEPALLINKIKDVIGGKLQIDNDLLNLLIFETR